MKILIAHNAYQHPGGEDTVVAAETALLREHGHDVETYLQHNDALNTMPRTQAALTTLWSRRTTTDIADLCHRFQPDLIHSHNTFPLISPSLYWSAARHRIPVVQTLHNFRLLCPQGIFLRDGHICEDCLGKAPWRSVAHKCYRNSAAQTAVLAGMLTAHRIAGTWRDRITTYIALTEFARDKYIEGGLPAERFRIKPNFVESKTAPDPERPRAGGLYVGRLSTEKGIDTLLEAARLHDRHGIEIIGDGPLREPVARQFADSHLGFRPLDDIMQRMHDAQFLVLPSICYENSPRTIVEAYASGLPVIASRLGALAGIVRDGITGLLFTPGDAIDLAEKIRWAQTHPHALRAMSRAARAEYEAKYTPERNHTLLMNIYEDALSHTQGERHAIHAT